MVEGGRICRHEARSRLLCLEGYLLLFCRDEIVSRSRSGGELSAWVAVRDRWFRHGAADYRCWRPLAAGGHGCSR